MFGKNVPALGDLAKRICSTPKPMEKTMKLETNLVHENGQYIHDGDPLYEGDKFIGRFRGLHDDGGPIQMVNVERPSGGGVTPFYIGVVENWDTRPATFESAPSAPHPDEVCSSPEQIACEQDKRSRREIEEYLLVAAQLPHTVRELVSSAFQPSAENEVLRAASAALQELAHSRHDVDTDIPF